MLNNRISVATITYATASPCRIPLNDMFHQDSARRWNKLQIKRKYKQLCRVKIIRQAPSQFLWTQYVCDKSENAQMWAKWQWNTLDWCYSNTVSCVSLSFRTHPCVLAIYQNWADSSPMLAWIWRRLPPSHGIFRYLYKDGIMLLFQTNVDKYLSCCMALPRSNELNIPIKYS